MFFPLSYHTVLPICATARVSVLVVQLKYVPAFSTKKIIFLKGKKGEMFEKHSREPVTTNKNEEIVAKFEKF